MNFFRYPDDLWDIYVDEHQQLEERHGFVSIRKHHDDLSYYEYLGFKWNGEELK